MNTNNSGSERNQRVQTDEQGSMTETVIKIAESIPNDESQLIQNVFQYTNSLTFVDIKNPDFSRNADQII